jgi:hypothetical protein
MKWAGHVAYTEANVMYLMFWGENQMEWGHWEDLDVSVGDNIKNGS